MNRSPLIRTASALLPMLLGVCWVSDAAVAQERPGREVRAIETTGPRFGGMPRSFSNLLQPDFHVRDVALLTQRLELDASQRPVIEALIIDYRQAFAEAAGELEHAVRQAPRLFGPGGRMPMAFAGGQGGRGAVGGRRMFGGPNGPANIRLRMPLDGEDVDVEISAEVLVITGDEAGAAGDGPADVQPEFSITIMNEDGVVIDGDVPPEVLERIEAVRERIEQRRERMQERIAEWQRREAEREANGEVMEPSEVLAVAREFRATKERLRAQFVEDLTMMLTPWQREQWSDAQQDLRRMNLLPQGRLSGEQVDLTHVLRDMHLSAAEQRALEDLLLGYAREMDEALAARQNFLERADLDRFEATYAENWDVMLALADDESTRRLAIRSLNDAYATDIQAILPAERRERFNQAVIDRAFPQVPATTRAGGMLRRAMELDELEPEQVEAIEQMLAEHDRKIAELNAQQRQSLRETEPQRQRQMLEMFQRLRTGDMEDFQPPMQEFMNNRRERMELARTYLDQLRVIVPDDMMPELHEPEPQRRWGRTGQMQRRDRGERSPDDRRVW